MQNQPVTIQFTEKETAAIEAFLKRFLSINHDLNNPLSGILGYGEFLLEESESFTPDQVDYVKQVVVCAERMSALIASYCEAKDELAEVIDVRRFEE